MLGAMRLGVAGEPLHHRRTVIPPEPVQGDHRDMRLARPGRLELGTEGGGCRGSRPATVRTDEDTIALVRRLAVHYPDSMIAGILAQERTRPAIPPNRFCSRRRPSAVRARVDTRAADALPQVAAR
jgi:hypothetical protein